MNTNELSDFTKLFNTTADYYGKEKSADAMMIYWQAMKPYDFDIVREIFNRHIQSSKFMPMVNELLDTLRSMDGRPEPEAAWSVLSACLNDEGKTVVWTEEMAQSFGVALGLQNDRVAARMAFLESYKSLVSESRRNGVSVKWTPSLGHNLSGREGPLLDAVKKGRLTRQHVVELLPYNDIPNDDVIKLLDLDKRVSVKKVAW
jgi:hypothetical protein